MWTEEPTSVLCYCTVLHGGGYRVRKTRKQREPFGRIRRLPSGRYQAAYTGPEWTAIL